MELSNLDKMKIVLREKDCPFFSDEELLFYLSENKNDIDAALYQCFLIKAENTTLNISFLNQSREYYIKY